MYAPNHQTETLADPPLTKSTPPPKVKSWIRHWETKVALTDFWKIEIGPCWDKILNYTCTLYHYHKTYGHCLFAKTIIIIMSLINIIGENNNLNKNIIYFCFWFKLIYLRSIEKLVILTYINHSRTLIPDGIHLFFLTMFSVFNKVQ